jgi:hypothetical protein
MSQRPPDPARRKILKRTRDATAAGVAVAVLGPAATVQAETAPLARDKHVDPAESRGYHESEHTRRYYELARF